MSPGFSRYICTFALFLPAAGFPLSASQRKAFEQLQIVLMLIITPLTFLGGAFYSVVTTYTKTVRTVTLFNVVYL
jgi:ABC-2 type transport system permease protein